jgi:hypothetical protein
MAYVPAASGTRFEFFLNLKKFRALVGHGPRLAL